MIFGPAHRPRHGRRGAGCGRAGSARGKRTFGPDVASAAAPDLTDRNACASPLPLVADGLLPDPGHHGLHHRARRRVDRVESRRPSRTFRARLRASVVLADSEDDRCRGDGRGPLEADADTTYIFVRIIRATTIRRSCSARCRTSCASSRRNRFPVPCARLAPENGEATCSSIAAIPIARGS